MLREENIHGKIVQKIVWVDTMDFQSSLWSFVRKLSCFRKLCECHHCLLVLLLEHQYLRLLNCLGTSGFL